MKIVAISDSHGQHWDIKIPKCDIFIHAGDAEIRSIQQLYDFNDWLGTLDVNIGRIIVAGNHDCETEAIGQGWCENLFTNAVYLQDKRVTLGGLKFYGSPWCPEFNDWSWMYPRRSKEARDIWNNIPEDTDILITHTMPYKILDTNHSYAHCGCEVLVRYIYRKNIKVQIGGHLHNEGGKILEKDGIKFCNASILDEDYKLTHKPIIIEI